MKIAERRGFVRQRRPSARQFQQHRAAGRVVHGAVVDAVAVHRGADAEMVPMRAEHNGLILQLADRCPERSPRRCVYRYREWWRKCARGCGCRAEWAGNRANRPSSAIRRPCARWAAQDLFAALSVIQPASASEGSPAVSFTCGSSLAQDDADHVPAVTGGRRGVDDDAATAPFRIACSYL